ncbi:MAG: alpha/beta fold hydrolase [Anaerolineales bacterium]|nr:alpha/beta fold hydrolase [Anaerolineales bacterium]
MTDRPAPPVSMFRTPAGEARYFAAYAATLALWPVPVESGDVPTRFGPTHVLRCGPPEAPPLVLLPGQAVSATMWHANVGALSQAYRLYAPDIVGDLGKSRCTRPPQAPADFSDWLSDVLDGLGLAAAHVAGLSYGGYIALRLAIGAPQRVRKLVVMAPAGLRPFRPQYFLRMASVFLPGPLASKQRALLGTVAPAADPVVKQMLTTTDFRYSMYYPPLCTDAELRGLQAPTLLLIGDREVVFDPRQVLQRAAGLIPGIETGLIPNAGHALTLDHPELVNARLLAFLAQPA